MPPKTTKKPSGKKGKPTKTKSLSGFAKKYNLPMSVLKKVYNKGMGAYYSSGSRPGVSPQQWALARVKSFATGGPARKVDAHLLKKDKKKSGTKKKT